MERRPEQHIGGRLRSVMARISVLALIATTGVAAVVGSPARAAAPGGAATVGNGLTTVDLGAVGMSPTALASTLVGTGVSVSNVTFTGANAQAGTIHLVDPAVASFNDAVILSSGNIADAVGPNKSDGITGDMAGPADPDLTALIANTQTVNPMTYDAAVLEFDFVPAASQVYFTYTFASDEYLEWVNLFNDVFAFYVNGQNCATVAGGSPVSIDTINSTVNPNLFRDNSFSSPPANPINIEYDGLSVELICSAPVNAGQTNHMKLAIADTSDQVLDSVVMIKAQSLSTTKPESCNDGVDNNDDLLVDDADPMCQATTTPPPPGAGGIGSGGNAPPFTGNEGTPIPLDPAALNWTATPDAITTTWTVTGINGTPGTCDVSPTTPLPVGAGGAIAVVTAICPNEGEYVARVSGWDIEGKSAFDYDIDFFVHNAPPSVTIDAPLPNTEVTVGTALGLSATVTDPGINDTVQCQIDWGDGTTEPGALSGGTCSGSHTWSTTGSKMVSVTATDGAGDSSAAATVVSVVAPGAAVASSANPSVKGQWVTFTGTTTVGTSGTMSFYDGATLLGTRTVVGGSASLATGALAAGSHAITVSYLPTPSSTPSVSSALTQQVDPAATSLALTSSANPSVAGQWVTVKASVSAVPPGAGTATGSVSLYDGGVLVATRSLGWGSASFSLRPSVGSHSYTAVYAGSSSFLGSSSAAPVTQQVDQAATAVALTSSANPSVSGQWITVKATVSVVAPGAGTATGSVSLYDGGVLVATRSLAWGSASFSLRPSVGSHSYTAVYAGSSNFLGSTTAAPLTQQVNP